MYLTSRFPHSYLDLDILRRKFQIKVHKHCKTVHCTYAYHYILLGSNYSRQFAIFKDGCPEDWIKWLMAFCEVENLMPMKEPADKTRMFRTLLKGQDLYYFEYHLMSRLEAKDSDVPDSKMIELVHRDIGLEYIPKRSICVQKNYMRRGLYMGLDTSVQQFVEKQRLNDLNHYLLYFPEENPQAVKSK
jgi:hypothetical protein